MSSKELQAKLEYYIISLSFTVLAFSIQTVGSKTSYNFNDEVFKSILYCLEFPSWICFALSGSIGIAKLLKISELLSWVEQESREIDNSACASKISELDKLVKKFEYFQYITLTLGFFALILSRILSICRILSIS